MNADPKPYPHRRDDLDGNAHCRCGVMAIHDPVLGETWGRNCTTALREALDAEREAHIQAVKDAISVRVSVDVLDGTVAGLIVQRDAALTRIAELEATLANERGEGEPPSEGWKARRRGGEARWVLHNERPGRVLDVVRRMGDAPRTIVSHWWDREVNQEGEVVVTHAEGEAETMRAAMRAAQIHAAALVIEPSPSVRR